MARVAPDRGARRALTRAFTRALCRAQAPKKINIHGWTGCPFFQRSKTVATTLTLLFPSQFQMALKETADREAYRADIGVDLADGLRTRFANAAAHSHTACPFVYFDSDEYLGGCDAFVDWSKAALSPSAGAAPAPCVQAPDGYASGHGYEYDLVVIGGGSGGLACSKEAARLGARVACLDFVKPSPAGTTWGLGGTCVNVGCIPKKLMHNAALIGETMKHDAAAFGWSAAPSHDWAAMRGNVQDHIKSLNFKYRVALREAGVAYLNKLGSFVDAHTLKCVDKKGKETTITSARFVVAVGGRPSPLGCPGAELAITSDDLFQLEAAPGKTCVVGGGYVALECGGFLHSLGYPVTCAVRSILLRGFDRECCDKIGAYMEHAGIAMKKGVTPASVEKTAGGKLKVSFSDGTADEFDTVVAAIGRNADTSKVGLDAAGVALNPKNGKIPCVNEQSTSAPHVYAIGDVVDGEPELTPVAIQAGVLLARRLFGGGGEPMDYKMVATAVFTPLEYGCVGLSEDDAIASLGAANVDAYISEFLPLEWSLSEARADEGVTKCFVKVRRATSPLALPPGSSDSGSLARPARRRRRRGPTRVCAAPRALAGRRRQERAGPARARPALPRAERGRDHAGARDRAQEGPHVRRDDRGRRHPPDRRRRVHDRLRRQGARALARDGARTRSRPLLSERALSCFLRAQSSGESAEKGGC